MSQTVLLVLALVIAAGVIAIIALLLRAKPPQADPAAEQRLMELNARLDAMGSWLQNSHTQLQQTVNTRLDTVSQNLGVSLQKTTHTPSRTCRSSMSALPSSTARRRTSPTSPRR